MADDAPDAAHAAAPAAVGAAAAASPAPAGSAPGDASAGALSGLAGDVRVVDLYPEAERLLHAGASRLSRAVVDTLSAQVDGTTAELAVLERVNNTVASEYGRLGDDIAGVKRFYSSFTAQGEQSLKRAGPPRSRGGVAALRDADAPLSSEKAASVNARRSSGSLRDVSLCAMRSIPRHAWSPYAPVPPPTSRGAVDKLRPVLEQVDALETAVSALESMAVEIHTQSKELESSFADLLAPLS